MPRGRISRWILMIQSYTFTIVHKKGIHNLDADALSRKYQQNNQDMSSIDLASFIKLQKEDSIISTFRKGEGRKHNPMFTWQEGVLMAKGVPVIPQQLVKSVLMLAHDGVTAGHFGLEKTLDKAARIGCGPQLRMMFKNGFVLV